MAVVLINTGTVILGSLTGLLFHRGVQKRFSEPVFAGVGFISLALGLGMTVESGINLVTIAALLTGGLLGTVLRIQGRLLQGGEFLKKRIAPGMEGSFSQGFLNASLLFCVGPMTILGALEAGLGNYKLLLLKSVLDGFSAVFLSAVWGGGVLFSGITVLVIQGGIALFARSLGPFLTPGVLSTLGALGGVLIMMIGSHLLGIKKVKTADFLPALPLGMVLAWLGELLRPWFPGFF